MKDLSIELHTFKSVAELTKQLDDEVSRIKTLLGEYLRRLDESRARLEKLRKTQEVISKLTGGKSAAARTGEGQTLDLMGLKVLVYVSPEDEAEVLEESVKTLQDKLNVLQRVRKALEPLGSLEEAGATLTAVMNDGIPTRILLKVT